MRKLNQRVLQFDTVRIGSIFYACYGVVLIACAFTGVSINGAQLEPLHAIGPALVVLGAAGTLRKRRWGYWMSYVFSVLMLPGMPFGTVLGYAMIRGLRRNRHVFR